MLIFSIVVLGSLSFFSTSMLALKPEVESDDTSIYVFINLISMSILIAFAFIASIRCTIYVDRMGETGITSDPNSLDIESGEEA